jgi:hypothetical protein
LKGHRFLGVAVAAALLGTIVFTRRLQTTPDRVYETRPPAAILAAVPFRFVEEADRLGLRFDHRLYYPNPEAGSYLPLMAFPPAIAVADFDGDGFMDVYVVQPEPGQPNRLFRNVGGDHFEDVAVEVGLADTNKRFAGSMAVWADFDGDGRLDLFQARFGCHSLFLRDPGPRVHFTEHPELTRFACSNPKAVNVGDLNRDGRPDVVLGNYYPPTNLAMYLPVNHVFGYAGANYQGGGAEVLLGTPRGFVAAFRGPLAHTQAIGLSDVDGDGWPDVFASNDYTYDQMFLGRGGRTFVEVTDAYIPRIEHGLSGMDAEFADFDNSGAMSLYVSNMYFPPFATTKNLLWKKKPDGHFVNVAEDMGVARCGWAWTGKFADFDNSGDLDLFVVNGKARGDKVRSEADATRSFAFVRNSIVASPPDLRQRMSLVPSFSTYYLSAFERSCLFWNRGGRFYDVATEAGITDREEGQSAALVDFDNDGRVDVVVANLGGPLLAYHNVTAAPGHWLGVDLVGPAGAAPYGAKVLLHRADGKTPMREYYPANGYRGQSDPRMLFGLGASDRAGDLEVRWADGRVETFRGLPVDRYTAVRYGGGTAR